MLITNTVFEELTEEELRLYRECLHFIYSKPEKEHERMAAISCKMHNNLFQRSAKSRARCRATYKTKLNLYADFGRIGYHFIL